MYWKKDFKIYVYIKYLEQDLKQRPQLWSLNPWQPFHIKAMFIACIIKREKEVLNWEKQSSYLIYANNFLQWYIYIKHVEELVKTMESEIRLL